MNENLKKKVIDSLTSFKTISLDEMKSVKLMNRIDTKYIVTLDTFFDILHISSNKYFVQIKQDQVLSMYHTIYFDTMAKNMYIAHLTGRKNREKIRVRTYKDTEERFLEIKHKNNHGRTQKRRIQIYDSLQDSKNSVLSEFLQENSKYDLEMLKPCIENSFGRITLVNYEKTERLTIDMGIHIHNIENNNDIILNNIAIVELKRDGNTHSPMKQILLERHIHECGFSKYCIGLALTDGKIRQNNFKEKINYLKKIIKSN